MFFLLYVPMLRKMMSGEQMEALATQLAEQVLAQTVAEEERTPETSEAVRVQILEMMESMQKEFGPMNRTAEVEDDAAPADLPAQVEPPELAHMRDFLERCFRKSA